ncbi:MULTISPECIES: chemotaxis protein CheW [Thermosipho]|uniref:Chemotaxis protein CheW n=1 Tax=Thermosipho affectus TaxID=660294 RepID=A0ABX3IHB1_9BACT|nr:MULTISPECIES: chemotaxis protein CheW [Thermosipho]ANQ53861.1 chemotaxis protein CheW [Thermosipho sp. 1070]APT72308.1 chemotaxis protein CheW [Thermosipho sp. 1063]MBT1247999.1 chemotaxis protein CheW [Thermosipho sp. 1244]ONN27213.1 chemotaxis protein CheW [Thermosipho affectus]OOC43681.1 chemotaxis protein CheW [Thermosipho sp. 1074]
MSVETEFEVLSFNVCNQEMSFDVDYVEIVIDKDEVTPVPKSKEVIDGVINLRGRIIPVVNLKKILGGICHNIENEEFKKIIITKIRDIEVGFLVENVKGVLRTSQEEIDKAFRDVDTYGKKAKGLIKKGERLVVYLDIEEILDEIIGVEEV